MRPDPYIPEQVADPKDFVGRRDEIEQISTYVEFSAASKPRNIAITGDWGIGKTALLRKFESIALLNGMPSARFDIRKDMSLVELQQRLLLELKSSLALHERMSARAKKFLSEFDVSVDYGGISVKKVKDPGIEFRRKLSDMWGGLKGSVPAALIMIDNAEGLKQIPGAIEELRNTFQRLGERECKYVLVVAGKPELFAGTSSLYEPFARFFNFVELKPFTYEETRKMIVHPLDDISGLKFDADCIAEIHRLSGGHPFIVKSICSTIYVSMKGEGTVTRSLIDDQMRKIVRDLGRKVFSDRFASASPEEQKLLAAMAVIDDKRPGYSLIADTAGMPKNKAGILLSRLADKTLVNRVERGKYEFFHPLFKEFIAHIVLGREPSLPPGASGSDVRGASPRRLPGR